MFQRKTVHLKTIAALVLLACPGISAALDIGFEGELVGTASDNVTVANAGSEIDGQLAFGRFGVFGQQRGRVIEGAFAGDLFSQRRLDLDGDKFDAVSQFLGAVNWKITPRTFSWYFGDILGGVRVDNGQQEIDDLQNERRNVFVTGPTFYYDIDAFSRINARVLYINQSQNEIELESLYNASFSWEVDTDRGNTWGLSFGDIYTDNPDIVADGDFNRLNLSSYWKRSRGRMAYEAAVGGTRYETENDSLNGLYAKFSIGRSLSPVSNVNVLLTRDLNDQNLSTIEELIDTQTGVQPDNDGFFNDTRLSAGYDYKTSVQTFGFGVGVSQSDYELVSSTSGFTDSIADQEDRAKAFVYLAYSRNMTTRLRTSMSVNFERQEYDNNDDETDSALGIINVFYRLSRTLELDFGFRLNKSEGFRSRDTENNGIIDETENRASIGLRWAPPTRASKNLTIQLKSLLQQ